MSYRWQEYIDYSFANDIPFADLMEKAYQMGRADERKKLLTSADCDNAECWNCAMSDGDMNCILKEQSND